MALQRDVMEKRPMRPLAFWMPGLILASECLSRGAATSLPASAIAVGTFSIALVLFVSTGTAIAHDDWISRNQFYDPMSRAWCCDEHDCFPLAVEKVKVMGTGFVVEGQYFVARHRVLPSSDGQYWACFNGEGRGPHDRPKGVRCFFAPMNT